VSNLSKGVSCNFPLCPALDAMQSGMRARSGRDSGRAAAVHTLSLAGAPADALRRPDDRIK
jgi:hypothetical protein